MTILQHDLKRMTPEMFAQLGENDVVYIKPILHDGTAGFAVHAASGRELAIFDSFEAAVAISMENNMHPTWLH